MGRPKRFRKVSAVVCAPRNLALVGALHCSLYMTACPLIWLGSLRQVAPICYSG